MGSDGSGSAAAVGVKPPRGRVTILHTSFLAVEGLTRLFFELDPDVELQHIVDDRMLDEVREAGSVTPSVAQRLVHYLRAAEASGSDLLFSQCSSVGDAVEQAARHVALPVVRIDARMAQYACEAGTRVGVAATLATTLAPTVALIEATARRLARPVEVETVLVEGAFADLEAGDLEAHHRKVAEVVRALAARVDVVVCAQGSMAAALETIGTPPVPVLTSPRLGVEHALEVLRERLAARSA